VYEPSADKVWATVWTKVDTVDFGTGSTLASVFTFQALSEASCAYDAKYCIPLPGVSFTEVTQGYCTFEIASGLFSTISSAAASTFDSIMSSEIADSVQSGIGESFSTFLNTWDVTIIVCVLAFVMGLVFLILLRFFIKPVVYFAVFAVFALFMALGVIAYAYATQCVDDELDTSALASVGEEKECLNYKVSSGEGRKALLYCAYICWILAAVYAAIIACLFKRIRLAVAVNAVAAQFVVHTPHIVLVPVIQGITALTWTIIWILMCTFLLSQVPDDYVDTTTAFDSYDSAYTNCVDGKWPEGGIYKVDSTGAWMCYQPRYAIDYRFWYSVLSFFWHHAFIVAVGQCTIAGAVGVWFFNRGEKGSMAASMLSVCTGWKNCFRYHLGSLAFGSFILAVIQTVRWFMIYLSKQAKAQGNFVMEIVLKVFAYCLWCFEKSVKFLNKNAYIQVALMATNFCTSAKNAFWLIARNAVRFGVLGSLGFIVHFIGKYLIMSATAVLGFLILQEMHADVSAVPVTCVLAYCVIGYSMGVLFMDVFGLAVDATLQCFIATEEMGIDSSFVPAKLRKFVADTVQSGDNQASKHETCCACCRGCC
jgi:hypothetical protein